MTVYEIKKLRDRRFIFADRREAGLMLASLIRSMYGRIKEGIILAIPSGGVPVGIAVSEKLDFPLDLAIARKLQIPGNTEAGFGAMTMNGVVFFNNLLLKEINLSSSQIEEEKKRVSEELSARNALFRKDRPFPSLKGKNVIIVDDGIASGYTMLASVHMAKEHSALKTTVAVPTAPMRAIKKIESEVDAIFCLNIRTAPYFAVAEAYRQWYDLNPEAVLELLEGSDRLHRGSGAKGN